MQHTQVATLSDSPRTLLHISLAEASGPDATAFLQSQLSSDVAALKPGDWQWSAWLNAKGRVIALIVLLRTSADSYWLILPDHPAADLVPALSRYVFRSKLTLRVVDDWVAAGCFGVGEKPGEGKFLIELAGTTPRRLAIVSAASAPAPADAAFTSAWAAEDLRAGVPRLPIEGGTHTAHMLSLDRLNAISLSKGCYPGQEIVARTHYLGQSKRGLGVLQLETDSPPICGTAVTLAEASCGEVLHAESIGTREVLAQVVLAQSVLSASDEGALLQVEGCRGIRLALSAPPLPPIGSPG